MNLTRREVIKGLSSAAAISCSSWILPSDRAPSFSSIDEIFASGIIIDDLSGFDPKPSPPDAGFSAVRESGITIVGPTLGDVTPEEAYHSTVAALAKTTEQTKAYPDRLMFIRSFADIHKAKQQNKLGILANIQNSAAIQRDLKNLDFFYNLGLRQIQLTFNWRNWVGDGCTERTQAGLSYFGVDMVQRMNELGMLVDVSHTGYQSTLDAVEVSKRPTCMALMATSPTETATTHVHCGTTGNQNAK